MEAQRIYRSMDGLDEDLLPMKLFQKGKQLGTWDPKEIDFSEDREHWEQLDDLEQEALLHLSAQFMAGEESVTNDLLPLIMVMAQEGRLEEEIYLTSFLFEEAKHVEAFDTFFNDVVGDPGDLTRFHGRNYREIFDERLPNALNRLREEPSPENQAEASATYNMIVEGVLAETGYHAYFTAFDEKQMFPGMKEVARNLKQDESRHMAYGVYLLSRLVAEHGEPVWKRIRDTMSELLPRATGLISEVFEQYDTMPLGLELGEFIEYATDQYQRRFERIKSAREKTVTELNAE